MKAEDIKKLAEEAAKKEFPDSQFSDADIWNRKCFISGYKAAQSDLEENATCACGDVFNENFRGVCPNCVAAQSQKEIERLSNTITSFDTKETPMKIETDIEEAAEKYVIKYYNNKEDDSYELAFKAGALWQQSQSVEKLDLAERKAYNLESKVYELELNVQHWKNKWQQSQSIPAPVEEKWLDYKPFIENELNHCINNSETGMNQGYLNYKKVVDAMNLLMNKKRIEPVENKLQKAIDWCDEKINFNMQFYTDSEFKRTKIKDLEEIKKYLQQLNNQQ